MSFAVIWCSDFPLQAVLRRSGRGDCVALVDDTKRQSVVLCSNANALDSGVEPGLSTVQALARCPHLQVRRPSAAAETAAGRVLLETALSWVPLLEETEAGLLTLDLSSQAEDDWLDSAREILDRLEEVGLDCFVGLGETPALARIASQAARQSGGRYWQLVPKQRLKLLDALPLTLAEVGAELISRLQLWGVKSLGQFARLRREEVASRLGDEGVALWLRLTGRLRRPLRPAKLEELFEASYEFDYEVVEREPLLFLLRRFADQLVERVSRTGRAITATHLLLTFGNGSFYAKRLALPEPTLDEEVLFRIVSGHIDTVEMKSAVVAFRLRAEPSDPIASQRTLFGTGLRDRHHYEETLKRIRRLVGADQVGSPRPLDHHRPDQFSLEPLQPEFEEHGLLMSGPPVTGPTFRRYCSEVRADVQMRDEEPVQVDSPKVKGIVTEAHGPWKCQGDWWHRGRRWDRVEWDVALMNQGLYRLVYSGGSWVVEGYYD